MEKSFDSFAFVEQVGADLVRDFEKARRATTPTLVGDAMEKSTRDSLEQLLPSGIAAGSGCVIDIEGNTSHQMDIVLYERGFCPVFCINNSPGTTYFPCEGVIAVGEVKSIVGKVEFDDAVKKMESVKTLKRQFRGGRTEYGTPHRNYGGTDNIAYKNFDLEMHTLGDMTGFILTGGLKVKYDTVLDYYKERTIYFPDMLISLEGGVFDSVKSRPDGGYNTHSTRNSDYVVCFESGNPFGFLVYELYQIFRKNVTAPMEAFEQYIIKQPEWRVLGRC